MRACVNRKKVFEHGPRSQVQDRRGERSQHRDRPRDRQDARAGRRPCGRCRQAQGSARSTRAGGQGGGRRRDSPDAGHHGGRRRQEAGGGGDRRTRSRRYPGQQRRRQPALAGGRARQRLGRGHVAEFHPLPPGHACAIAADDRTQVGTRHQHHRQVRTGGTRMRRSPRKPRCMPGRRDCPARSESTALRSTAFRPAGS